MTAQPADRIPASGPDTGPYELIHLGGQAAVVVPVSDFLRLQALEQAASSQELEDADDKAALADWRAREAAGLTSYIPHDEVLRRLGLAELAVRSSGRPRRSSGVLLGVRCRKVPAVPECAVLSRADAACHGKGSRYNR